MKTVIGLTGASGSIFGVEFLKALSGDKYLVCSKWGKSVLAQETGETIEDLAPYVKKVFSNEDMSSPLASGANPIDAVVIVPCSASTMAKIAAGIADSLMTRIASVALKERKKLIICLRETPLSTIHIEAMLKLSQAGATIMPVTPSFYQNGQSIKDLAKLFAERLCQMLDSEVVTTGWKKEQL